jgi:mono/diheme cytochrome c family protein
MKRGRSIPKIILFIAVFGLAGCSGQFIGYDTPMPIPLALTMRAMTPSPTVVVFPLFAPNPEDGEAIFIEKCSGCHGITGMGDGVLSTSLSQQPPAIGLDDVIRQIPFNDVFTTVTNGSDSGVMPAFSNLSEMDRWNTVAYVYSMSFSPSNLSEGREIFGSYCTSCHGNAGEGDGDAVTSLGISIQDWTDQSVLSSWSQQDLFDTISAGTGETMQAFAPLLSEDQRWEVTDYIRSLTFTNPVAWVNPTPMPTRTPQPSPTPEYLGSFDVGGYVRVSGNMEIPEGLVVSIVAYYRNPSGVMTPYILRNSSISQTGGFGFEDVEITEGAAYTTQIEYGGVVFTSETVSASQIINGTRLLLPIMLYETTTDTNNLYVDRWHVFLDFTTPGTVTIGEMFVINNPTNRVVIAQTEDAGVLDFLLPDDIQNLVVADGELGGRFSQSESLLSDRQVIPPGSNHQVIFTYTVPYTGSRSLVLESPLAVNLLIVMMPSEGILLRSPSFDSSGIRIIQDSSMRFFTAMNLPAATTVNCQLIGLPPDSIGTAVNHLQVNEIIGIGILLATIFFIIFGFKSINQKRKEVLLKKDQDPEALLEEILVLDDLYQAGKISDINYVRRRVELKEKLLRLEKDQNDD